MTVETLQEAKDASVTSGRPVGFLAVVVAALLIATSIPYVICYRTAPPGQRFTGVLFVRVDTDSYYAWMNQARHGHWLFENKYQPQPHAGAYFNAFWAALGGLARAAGISLEASLHVGRLAAGALLVMSFYAVSGFWLRTHRLRALALLLFIFGGGFGWATAAVAAGLGLPHVMELDLTDPRQAAVFNFSMDLWAGFHPFMQVFLSTHFALAHALYLYTLYCFLRSEASPSPRYALGAGAILLVLSLSHPYDAVTALATCALYAGVQMLRRRPLPVGRLLVMFGPPVAGLLYYVWLFKVHPYFKYWGRAAQSIEPNLYVLFALGLCGLIGLAQFLRLTLRPPAPGGRPVFLMCWLAAAVGLFGSYPVLKFSGQFGLVLMGPLVLMTAVALQEFSERAGAGARRRFYAAAAALLILNSLTAPILLYQRTASPQEFHVDERVIAALEWLNGQAPPHEAVLASEDVGLRVPVYTQNYVFLGHPHLCDDYDTRSRQVAEFFDGAGDEARRALLREQGIAYVFHGPAERALGGFDPAAQPYLRRVYGDEAVAVYRVLREAL